MPTTASRLRTRVQIETAIVRAETELTLGLERLEERRADGLDCTVAEGLVRFMQTHLANLHLRREELLRAEKV
jgi:hypothetical protein